MNSLDQSFVAFSHPVRRAIVERLAAGPATVGEAARGVGVSKPAVTKHVKLLERAGVVRRSVVGREHRLRLEPRPLDEAQRWLTAMWERKFDAVEQHLAEGG